MSNQLALTKQHIQSLSPMDVASDETIGKHFVQKFRAMYRVPEQQAVAFYEREKDNFLRRIEESESLQKCTAMSLFKCFMQVGGWKLSLDTGSQPDVYIISGNRKIIVEDENGKKSEQWIQEATAQPSPYGELKIRKENRQISHTGNPTVVYDCDDYEEYLGENGRTKVRWKKGSRTEKSRIVGGFILLEYHDNTSEFKIFDMIDVATWEKASTKKNKGKTNLLYGYEAKTINGEVAHVKIEGGQIDRKFFEGKILKHAFKLFPRVIATQNLPEGFVPNTEDAIRQGFDTSEFTEDIEHEVVEEKPDDFKQELQNQQSEKKQEATVIIESNDPDEPAF